MEEFEEVDVVRVLSKMFFKEEIDCCFKHEGIINRYFANTRLLINSAKERWGSYTSIPTRLSSTRD